jgi:hypothetical protein
MDDIGHVMGGGYYQRDPWGQHAGPPDKIRHAPLLVFLSSVQNHFNDDFCNAQHLNSRFQAIHSASHFRRSNLWICMLVSQWEAVSRLSNYKSN